MIKFNFLKKFLALQAVFLLKKKNKFPSTIFTHPRPSLLLIPIHHQNPKSTPLLSISCETVFFILFPAIACCTTDHQRLQFYTIKGNPSFIHTCQSVVNCVLASEFVICSLPLVKIFKQFSRPVDCVWLV